MNLLFRVLFAAHCRSTHHKLALDALRHLECPRAERWRSLFLKHYAVYFCRSQGSGHEVQGLPKPCAARRAELLGRNSTGSTQVVRADRRCSAAALLERCRLRGRRHESLLHRSHPAVSLDSLGRPSTIAPCGLNRDRILSRIRRMAFQSRPETLDGQLAGLRVQVDIPAVPLENCCGEKNQADHGNKGLTTRTGDRPA